MSEVDSASNVSPLAIGRYSVIVPNAPVGASSVIVPLVALANAAVFAVPAVPRRLTALVAVVALVAVAAVFAVMLVLQANPVPLVHCKALAAVEHEGTDSPVGATAVSEPRSWLAPSVVVSVPAVVALVAEVAFPLNAPSRLPQKCKHRVSLSHRRLYCCTESPRCPPHKERLTVRPKSYTSTHGLRRSTSE